MSTAPESIIKSIIHITEQRQLTSLIESLILTIEQTLTNVKACVYEIDIYDNYSLVANIDAGLHIDTELDKTIRAAITSCTRHIITDGDFEHAIFPICINGRTVKVLVVEAQVITDLDLSLLSGFSRIYENFFRVVVESETDGLTCLFNRKAFEARLLTAVEISNQLAIANVGLAEDVQDTRSFWLCIFDVDHFKQVNDVYGHLYGDEVLLQVANVMRHTFLKDDVMFRFGGDEFVVLLSLRTEPDVKALCDLFRQRIAALNQDKECRVTVSLGVVIVGGVEDPHSLVIKADKALYYSKEHGRNQVSYYHDLLSRGDIHMPVIDDDIELF